MTISGETIDYGPCAFMDTFSIDSVFSSIDHNGRYAFGNQAHIGQWNLARFAQALLPLLHTDTQQAIDLAEEAIEGYGAVFNEAWLSGMRRKLGLLSEEAGDLALIQSLFEWMQKARADYTATFRGLISEDLPDGALYQTAGFSDWHGKWKARLARNSESLAFSLNEMRSCNPIIIPRNQHVEDALNAAQDGNLEPFLSLLAAIQRPYELTENSNVFAMPPAHSSPNFQTFCGT
jgi:uncharacterized protein YdiU (UPF0061 family)